ncbi:hypothetical protein BJV82DRAFT_84475 [Fennellomyces sp. T-0311]|nr:hypothetical protein BJV82DRAFT_84475 [Fennellomyces sp. T-0311]
MPADSLNESDREQSSRNKSKQKQKATVDYLKEWSDSSENDDDDQGKIETAKEKRERLKQQKQEEREAKARQRKETQDAKKAERERAKEEKKAERERKKLFEQANRLRTDRHKLLSEMILDVHPDFAASPHGELLISAIEPKKAEIRVTNTDRYTIGWHRKCTAAWDDEEGSFVPHELRIIEEPKVLVFMDIPRLCEFIQSSTMDAEIDRIQESAGSRQILLMIEGLETYYKKKTLLKQRDFERAVLENLSQGSSSRKKGKTDSIIEAAKSGPTKEEMENRLAYLQMMKSVMLVPTTDREDSVDWLIALTTDIANAMYKHRNNKHLRHQGPSKSGIDAADTWSRMLQEIQLCTPPVARAIISSYPTVQSLFRAYERTPDVRDKEDLLADLEVERSVLASRDRTINKSMSKKVYTIFTCTNDEHYIA